MEIDKVTEDADIVRFNTHKESNSWGMFKDWTKQGQLGSY
jgi:hypothetical protein